MNFNRAPATPTALKTNPASSCSGGAIGLGPVSLSATVSDADGGTVGATFTVTNSTTKAVVQKSDPQVTHATSGPAISYALDPNLLVKSAAGKITTFDWTASATDYKATSGTATCHFNFDSLSPGAPTVTLPPTDGVTIGQPVSFTASPSSASASDQAGAYLVQLNGAAPVRYTATSGVATFAVTPTGLANTLTVTSVSATGTNIGQPADQIFNAEPSGVPSTDQDLTGDGVPDLLAAGGPGTNLPSGLWVSPGDPIGGIDPSPVDVGLHGDGLTGDNLPADFNGARAISGLFNPGADGLQDILIYQPQGAALNEGGGEVLDGNGDGSPIDSTSGQQHTISAGTLDDQFDYPTNVAPLQLVNAGTSSGHAYADLLGIGGDPTDGYSLWFYSGTYQVGVFDGPIPMLGLTTPADGTDWDTWTLASAQVGGQTDVYLWQRGTGALYLWSNLVYDGAAGTLDYTQAALGTWNTGASLSLQAADIDADGNPDLWSLGAGGATTAWLSHGTSLTALAPRTLAPAAHTWHLAEGPKTGQLTSAVDAIGGFTATGNAGVSWDSGGLFDPDASFNGTTGALTSRAALATNADFTVSVWARPTGSNQYVLSQDAGTGAGFALYINANNLWNFGMTQTDAASPTWDTASFLQGSAQYGVWQHVTATYNKTTGVMALYVNVPAGTHAHTATSWNATGSFQMGDYLNNKVHTRFYKGELADVQVWNQTLTPRQVASLSGTPGYIILPSDGQAYPSGAAWASKRGRVSFSQGQLSVTETCRCLNPKRGVYGG